MLASNRWIVCTCLCLLGSGLTGCTESNTAKVHGTVTCNGVPVTKGFVKFLPQPREGNEQYPGKPASGALDAEGRYNLSTYKTGDGAVIGKCKVVVHDDYPQPDPNQPDEDVFIRGIPVICDSDRPPFLFVVVEPRDNEINIDLTSKSADGAGDEEG